MVRLLRGRTAKTPARRGKLPGASGGGRFAKLYLLARAKRPSYILDFSLSRRCQAVGNWILPGGVMFVAHPPACVDDIWNLAFRCRLCKRKAAPELRENPIGKTTMKRSS